MTDPCSYPIKETQTVYVLQEDCNCGGQLLLNQEANQIHCDECGKTWRHKPPTATEKP